MDGTEGMGPAQTEAQAEALAAAESDAFERARADSEALDAAKLTAADALELVTGCEEALERSLERYGAARTLREALALSEALAAGAEASESSREAFTAAWDAYEGLQVPDQRVRARSDAAWEQEVDPAVAAVLDSALGWTAGNEEVTRHLDFVREHEIAYGDRGAGEAVVVGLMLDVSMLEGPGRSTRLRVAEAGLAITATGGIVALDEVAVEPEAQQWAQALLDAEIVQEPEHEIGLGL